MTGDHQKSVLQWLGCPSGAGTQGWWKYMIVGTTGWLSIPWWRYANFQFQPMRICLAHWLGRPVSPNCTCLWHIFFFCLLLIMWPWTHKGLYQYNCLPFGVASAPALFQEIMEKILQGLPHVVVYIDLLITGQDEQDHLQVLEQLVQCLEEYGLRLKLEKAGSATIQWLPQLLSWQTGPTCYARESCCHFRSPSP